MICDKLKPPPIAAVCEAVARLRLFTLLSAAFGIACGFMFACTARSNVIFSNLGPGDSFQQFSLNDVRGPDSLAGNQDLAGSFTVGSSASLLDNVEVAFSSGSGSVNVQLWSDSADMPGAVLASALVTDLPTEFPPQSLSTVDLSHAELTLSANTKYWLVADADGTSKLFWHYNDTGHEGFGVRTGGGWSSFSAFNAPAFRINASEGGSSVDGDFNADGSVDAADYVLWRHGNGSSYDETHYAQWQAHFGQSSGVGLSAGMQLEVAVAEPASLSLIGFSVSALLMLRRCQIWRPLSLTRF